MLFLSSPLPLLTLSCVNNRNLVPRLYPPPVFGHMCDIMQVDRGWTHRGVVLNKRSWSTSCSVCLGCWRPELSQGNINTAKCSLAPPPMYWPYLYLTSHMTRSPRPCPSVVIYCKWLKTRSGGPGNMAVCDMMCVCVWKVCTMLSNPHTRTS